MPSKSQKIINNSTVFVILGIVAIIGVYKLSSTETGHPCDQGRYLLNCYEVEHDICLQKWDSTKAGCQKQIEALNLPPGRLTSPIMDRCQRSKFDRVFRYLRKKSADCDQEFFELEEWRKSNPDF